MKILVGIKHMIINKSAWIGICLVMRSLFVVHCQSPALNDVPGNDTNTSAEKIGAMVRDLRPDGLEPSNDVEIFKPENLYEKINGRAEYYLSYDMIWAVFGSFSSSNDGPSSIELAIYNMGSPTYSFGVFSGERSVGAPPLELGREAYYSEGSYYIWKGQYYIQISAIDTIHKLQQICLDMAEKITDKLNDSDEPVWGLQSLPSKNRVPNSVQYFLIDALGHSFLHDTYTAKYQLDKNEIPVFLARQESAESAGSILEKFKDHFMKYGKGVEIISVDNIEFMVCQMSKYYDVIFQKGSVVAGVTGLNDKNLAVKASVNFYNQIQVE
jgi:hypothetical protein